MAAKSIVHSESIKLATVIMVNRYLVGMTISQISLQSQETNCHEVHESHDISMYKYFTNPSSPISLNSGHHQISKLSKTETFFVGHCGPVRCHRSWLLRLRFSGCANMGERREDSKADSSDARRAAWRVSAKLCQTWRLCKIDIGID